MMLRDHSRPCSLHPDLSFWEGDRDAKVWFCSVYACPGGAPVEGERIQWCKTHDLPRCSIDTCPMPDSPHCLQGSERRCKFVPALIVEVEPLMLRDHSRPCDGHGSSPHYEGRAGYWYCDRPDCPGGAPVVIDYEAAAIKFSQIRQSGNVQTPPTETDEWLASQVVNAALGIVEVDDE